MLKDKKKVSFWIIIAVVAVLASLATVAILVLRAKKRKQALQEGQQDAECCMSFDCTEEDGDEIFDEIPEEPVEVPAE
jgi:flagellar basal body-associated protein FliL